MTDTALAETSHHRRAGARRHRARDQRRGAAGACVDHLHPRPRQPVSHRLHLRPSRQRDGAADRSRDRRARRRARGAAVRLRHGGGDQRGAGAAAGRAHPCAEGHVLGAAQLADERGAALRLHGRPRRHAKTSTRCAPRCAPTPNSSGSRRRQIRCGASPTSRPSPKSPTEAGAMLGDRLDRRNAGVHASRSSSAPTS